MLAAVGKGLSTLWGKFTSLGYKLVAVIFAFLVPIHGVLLAVGMFILADTVIGIWKAKKLKEKITSRRLSNVIQKMFVYQLVVITFFCLGHFIINDIVKQFINIDYLMTKIVAVILISIEFYSIDESFEQATGKGIFTRLTDLIKKYKDVRKEVKEK